MDKQEIFDTVKRHLLAQNARAFLYPGTEGTCAYLAPDGKKCAVGCLIPPELYDECIEGISASFFATPERLSTARDTTKERETLIAIRDAVGLKESHAGLLSSLQSVHDNIRPEDWADRLEHTATVHNLRP